MSSVSIQIPLPTPPPTQAHNSQTFCAPPLGSLTLPEVFDWHSKNSPNHPLYSYINIDGSIRTITWAESVRAVHRAARRMRTELGLSSDSVPDLTAGKPVVGILAVLDSITYSTLVTGVQYAGFTPFPISPRNSHAAVVHLINKAFVSHIIVEESCRGLLEDAFQSLKSDLTSPSMPTTSVAPVFEDLYVSSDSAQGEASVAFETPAWDSNAIIIHSSGSTAFPKPIAWTHGRAMQLSTVPWYGERDLTGKRMACHAMPMYHTMGYLLLAWAASSGLVLNVFRPQSPATKPTIENVFSASLEAHSDIIFTVPSFVEAWSKNPAYVKTLAELDGVMFGGGPLGKQVGDVLVSANVTLFNLYGSTEAGVLSSTVPADFNIDWEYFRISDIAKVAFVPNEENKLELVVLSSNLNTPSVFNAVYEDVPAYATSDLFEPHPTKPGYWKIFGRTDDQIMHSTGEKTNPGPLEHILNQDPHVRASLMFGRGQFQAGVLVDPTSEYRFDPSDEEKLAEFRNLIWPSVEEMNAYAPQHSRVFKEMILVSSPSKPFTFTAKNSVRRQAVIQEYDDEIKAIYFAVDETGRADIPSPTAWDSAKTLGFIRAVVQKVMKKEVQDGDDFFQHGCDSLQATWIRNTILRSLKDSTDANTQDISNSFVYQHPSVASLASFVSSVAQGQNNINSGLDRAQEMNIMVARYSKDFPPHVPSAPQPSKDTILLTGSTGALGSNILALLIASPSVARIYAFNRKSRSSIPLLDRQKSALLERGLDPSLAASKKVVLVEGDVTKQDLGISTELLSEIRVSITHIIHNAWPVNFNLSLESFEPQVKGLRHLVDLSLSSPHPSPPRVLFTASIGMFNDITRAEPVKEVPIGANVAVSNGYGESKWVGETILAEAAKQTPLRSTSIRVGQLSGGINGAWTTAEWLPSLVRSAIHLKALPDCEGDVSWIPVNVAAAAIVDFCQSDSSIMNLVHPRPATWSSIFSAFASVLNIPLVPYTEWLALLRKSAEDAGDAPDADSLQQNPGLRLLDWYHSAFVHENDSAYQYADTMGFPKFDMTNSLRASGTLADEGLPQLGESDVKLWVDYWKKVGFFPA